MAGNGLFTSSTSDPDWKTAHGLLPRSLNALKVKVRCGARLRIPSGAVPNCRRGCSCPQGGGAGKANG
jgi:hypothetical protein